MSISRQLFGPVKSRLICVGHSFVADSTIGTSGPWTNTKVGNRTIGSTKPIALKRLTGQAFDYDGNDNYGVIGQTSPEVLARLPAILDARKADAGALYLDMLLNNFGSRSGELAGGPYQQSIDDVAAAVALARAAGLHVFLNLIPPAGTAAAVAGGTNNALSATNLALAGRVRRKLVDLYGTSEYVTLLDGYDAYADTASALGYARPNSTRTDGLHPGTFGAFLSAKKDKAKFERVFRSRRTYLLPNGNHGRYDANNPLGGLLSNPMLVYTSGGTLGAGGTGTIPDGWEGASGGVGLTRDYAIVADNDGQSWLRITLGGTPSADADCNILAQVSPALLATAVAAGGGARELEGVLEWKADKITGLGAIFTRLYSGATIWGIEGHYSSDVGYCGAGLSIDPAIDRTPPMLVNTGTATFGYTVRVRSGVPVDAVLYVRCADLRPLA